MQPFDLPEVTRKVGAPLEWDEATQGPCETLGIVDMEVSGVPFMVSGWRPTPDELASLNAGAAVFLGISGDQHPVVFISVATDIPHQDRPLPDGSHALCRRCRRGEIDGLDDGSWVALEQVSGGAHPSGYYGEISLSFHKPGEPLTVRHYIAQDILDQGKTQFKPSQRGS